MYCISSLLVVILVLPFALPCNNDFDMKVNAYYIEQRPYIFKENGELQGMIPDVLGQIVNIPRYGMSKNGGNWKISKFPCRKYCQTTVLFDLSILEIVDKKPRSAKVVLPQHTTFFYTQPEMLPGVAKKNNLLPFARA